MTDPFTPRPEHHFTFGLWTVGNPGRDPFGHEVRPPLDPVDSVHHLAELGAYGVSFHDDDLVPYGSSPAEREAIVKRFRQALDDDRHEGADGDDEPVLAAGVQGGRLHRQRPAGPPLRRGQDPATPSTSAPSSAPRSSCMWGGREGVEADAAKDVRLALDRYKEAVDLAASTSASAATTCGSRSSPSPTSRAATSSCRPSATRWPSSASSSGPTWSGSTRSSPTRRCPGLNFTHGGRPGAVARASSSTSTSTPSGSASSTRTSASAPRASATPSTSCKLLEDAGWDGMRHFDAHAYRTEDADGVWDFAAGCMRTYLILEDKAERFHDDAEIQEALRVGQGRRSSPSRPAPPAASMRCRGDLRRGRAGRAGLRPRAARPARHRAAARRPLMPLVAGVDSSTSACKVEVRDADTGELVASGRAPHPPTTPPRSEQHPRDGGPRSSRPAPRRACPAGTARRPSPSPASSTAWSSSTPTARCCGPAKLWNDTESAPDADDAGRRHSVRRGVGRRPAGACRSPASPSPSCAGCAAASPRPSRALAQVLLPHDWLTSQLTGAGTTDRGDASGTGYWSPAEERYRYDLLALVDDADGVGRDAPRGPGARREPAGEWDGDASSARAPATTWPPPSASGLRRATSP